MEAFKTSIEIDKGLLSLQLPQFFYGKKVEVIVIEVNDEKKEEKIINGELENEEVNEFQQFLMTAPTWSDTEYNNFKENKKLFNQWTIK